MCLNRLQHLNPTESFSGPGAEDQYPPDQQIEPIHLDADLKVDVVGQCLSGTVTVTAAARAPGAERLILDAVAFLDVVVKDPDGHELSWRYDGEKIHVRWAKGFATAEKRRVEIVYRIEKPVTGLFFMNPSPAMEKQPSRIQPTYAATDHETERARFWLPCVDLPHVRTTLDFHLTAEKRFTILANGSLISEKDHGDSTKTAHWRLEQPCPSYLICFAVGDFIRADDGECTPLLPLVEQAHDDLAADGAKALGLHAKRLVQRHQLRVGKTLALGRIGVVKLLRQRVHHVVGAGVAQRDRRLTEPDTLLALVLEDLLDLFGAEVACFRDDRPDRSAGNLVGFVWHLGSGSV